MKHPLPKYIPEEVGYGDKVNITNKGGSTTLVPREPGNSKSVTGSRDHHTNQIDAYFLGQLLALYQGNVFSRLNLDAGRLNDLIDQDIVVPLSSEPSVDAMARFRVDLGAASEFFNSLTN